MVTADVIAGPPPSVAAQADDPAPSQVGIEFPGREHDEFVQFYFRQHWIRLARPFGKMLLWFVVLGIATFFTAQINAVGQDTVRHIMLLLLSLLFFYSQLDFLNEFYRHFLHMIVITNRKVHRIKKTLFLVNDHQSVNVVALQDIHKSQRGPFQNLLSFGTLTLEAQESVLRIHFVPDVQRKYNALLHLRGWEENRAVQQQISHVSPSILIEE